jgi:hypothetical protein
MEFTVSIIIALDISQKSFSPQKSFVRISSRLTSVLLSSTIAILGGTSANEEAKLALQI